MDWGKPYERGPTCGACRKSCKNNLCGKSLLLGDSESHINHNKEHIQE